MITRRHAVGALAGLAVTGPAAAAMPPQARSTAASRDFLIETRQKLLMIGDSITDAGRARPVGEGDRGDGVGRGYVMLVDALLGAVYPERFIRVLNLGTSGNTTRDLKERWQADVLDHRPDWVSLMIGANDVWRQFDLPRQTERHVLIDEYEANLVELVAATRPVVKGLVLFTPFYLEPNRQDPMRATMDRYGEVVRKVASQTPGIVLVETQAAFDALLKVVYPATINWDRVHLNATGNMVVARAFLDAVGFDWRK